MFKHSVLFLILSIFMSFDSGKAETINIPNGLRPHYLVGLMKKSKLKEELQSCAIKSLLRSDFSIGHRGAPMKYPEHTKESYEAAVSMGAGIVECDVTFTKDRALVCRHSQCDLHTTTDILNIPELAAKCSVPFSPAKIDLKTGGVYRVATAKCCTSDISLSEFKRLKGKVDGYNPNATTPNEYIKASRCKDTNMYLEWGAVMSHAESIDLFKELGVKMIPELKQASMKMPFEGTYTQEQYAQQMIDEYKKADVDASQVFVQSFNLNDILYWIKNEKDFGSQAVYLDDKVYKAPRDHIPSIMKKLSLQGVNYIAPPIWVLLKLSSHKKIIPSAYASAAKNAGMNLITWTLERSKFTKKRGGWYYQTINENINNEGDIMTVLDVLAQDVGIKGIFSDWPATVTYYANCKGL